MLILVYFGADCILLDDFPGRILHIALVTNKYSTLFYLKVARSQRLKVNCAEIEILETI